MHLEDNEILQRKGAPLPVYYRLQETLRGKIEDGQWKPGEAIPSERLITEEYKISIGTVKKALGNLVDEGYLYRVQGKGTFVGKSTLRQESLRYYRLVKEFGHDMADLEVRILGIRELKGFDPANRFLRISADQSLFEMKRLFSSDEKPVVYAVSYIPKSMFMDFEKHPHHGWKTVHSMRSLKRITACPPSETRSFSARPRPMQRRREC